MLPKGYQSCKKLRKSCTTFICETCDYTTSRKSSYDKHLLTKKHKEKALLKCCQTVQKVAKSCAKEYVCENCDKKYKDRSGLWRHQKKCKKPEKTELKPVGLYTQSEVDWIQGLVERAAGTTNNINKQINNNININVFLNEHCKDALNLSDFVDSIKVQLEDVLKTHNLGSIEDGTTNIILNQLNDISMNERPIHCTDKKRNKFYIKDNDTWKKEDGKKIGDVVNKMQHKHVIALEEWEKLHPHYLDVGHKDNNTWQRMINTLTSPVTEKKKEKVIKEIASQVSLKDAMDQIKS
jgi:protein-arginine kinase activator protein McsA